MKDFKIDNKGSTRLFRNSFLERLTRTNFAFPVIFYLFTGIFFIWFAIDSFDFTFINYLVLLPSGMILFTLVEYLIHRFVFHFTATNAAQLDLQYRIHGVHHEFPRDKDRLVMPPLISVFIAALFLLFFRLLFPERGYILFAGFIIGYSMYLLIHYAVHAKKPPRNFLRFLWKHHSMHHYASVHSAFSVSFPFWDMLFGTMPPEHESPSQNLPDTSSRLPT